jgi:hypothetical protein
MAQIPFATISAISSHASPVMYAVGVIMIFENAGAPTLCRFLKVRCYIAFPVARNICGPEFPAAFPTHTIVIDARLSSMFFFMLFLSAAPITFNAPSLAKMQVSSKLKPK